MNFKCSIENEKTSVILKEIEPSLEMKQFEKLIAEKMQLSLPFKILTGYPPSILLYDETDPVCTKFKGNDLLIISMPKEVPNISKVKNLPTTAKNNLDSIPEKKKPSFSAAKVSFFSDQIKSSASRIGNDKQMEDDDANFELDESDDGVVGIDHSPHFFDNFLVQISRPKRNRPTVQYKVLDEQQDPPKSKKKTALKRKNSANNIESSNKIQKKNKVNLLY